MKQDAQQVLDSIGLQGSPADTLKAFKLALKDFDLKHVTVTIISDWQDRRDSARYAVLVRQASKVALSADAFGTRYGQIGQQALKDLLEWMAAKGAVHFKESVLAPHEFKRFLEYPDDRLMLQVVANANPASPKIWSDVLDQ